MRLEESKRERKKTSLMYIYIHTRVCVFMCNYENLFVLRMHRNETSRPRVERDTCSSERHEESAFDATTSIQMHRLKSASRVLTIYTYFQVCTLFHLLSLFLSLSLLIFLSSLEVRNPFRTFEIFIQPYAFYWSFLKRKKMK